MKKIFWGAASLALLVPMLSFAAEFRSGENASIGAQERISNDVYIGGGSVISAGAVTGDLVAGGGTVLVNGPVGMDLIAGGGTITILGSVERAVRVAGGNILIQGKVTGDVIVAGGQVTITGAGVGGDLVAAGGSVRVDAPVAGTVRVAGGTVYLNGPIAGNVIVRAKNLTLGSQAVISGSLTYTANAELTKESGAIVRGETKFTAAPKQTMSAANIAALASFFVLGKFLALLACALILGLFFKRYSTEVIARAASRPLLELGRGLVASVALPALSVLALVTLVGIPLGILGLVSFVAVFLFAWIVTPIILGSIMYRAFFKRDVEVSWKTILLGAVLFSILGLVPFLGRVVQGLLILLSLGAIVAVKWEIAKEWR
jgi:cytoskeletal protein CcmA (bactofilin family)